MATTGSGAAFVPCLPMIQANSLAQLTSACGTALVRVQPVARVQRVAPTTRRLFFTGSASTSFLAQSRLTVATRPGSAPFHTPTRCEAAPTAEGSSATATDSSAAIEEKLTQVFESQRALPRVTPAESCRTIMHVQKFGVLSSLSSKTGYPSGSVVGFATDGQGRPIFSFSTLSAHTQNVEKDGRVSLTVTDPEFKGADDARLTITGDVARVPDNEVADVRELYLSEHPNAFYVDFGDFSWFRLDAIKSINYVGGFARAATVAPEEYIAAQPDPLVDFTKPVMNHMNKDHEADVRGYVWKYLGLETDGAKMKTMDRLGFDVDVRVAGTSDSYTLRVPFPMEVTSRKAIKEALVAMSQAVATPDAQ